MGEKVKATRDDPQGAPAKKSAELPRPPLKFGKLTLFLSVRALKMPNFDRSGLGISETPIYWHESLRSSLQGHSESDSEDGSRFEPLGTCHEREAEAFC